jgi:hypothetical protein
MLCPGTAKALLNLICVGASSTPIIHISYCLREVTGVQTGKQFYVFYDKPNAKDAVWYFSSQPHLLDRSFRPTCFACCCPPLKLQPLRILSLCSAGNLFK